MWRFCSVHLCSPDRTIRCCIFVYIVEEGKRHHNLCLLRISVCFQPNQLDIIIISCRFHPFFHHLFLYACISIGWLAPTMERLIHSHRPELEARARKLMPENPQNTIFQNTKKYIARWQRIPLVRPLWGSPQRVTVQAW
jgi:glutamate racemase